MGRPWIEGVVLLAAHGHAVPSGKLTHPLIRSLRMRETETGADLPRFAFLTRLDGLEKPTIYPDIHALARSVERRRDDQAIQLVDFEEFEIPGQDGLHTAVQVFSLLLDNSRDQCLGWAWLDGHGRERFEPALRQARMDSLNRRRAA